MRDKKHLVVLTGAGISAESGLRTFRDDDGLWNGYNVYEVATPGGFRKNPQLVLDFYNMRRKDVAAASPNAAHKGLADLENDYDVTIITQNIDDLHERAGSSKIIHLHGEIFKMHAEGNPGRELDCRGDINCGDLGDDGTQLRPHIVWFEEPVPMIEVAASVTSTADIFVIIGTSLQVYPAASLIDYVPFDTPIYIIDKHIPQVGFTKTNITPIEATATAGITKLRELLRN